MDKEQLDRIENLLKEVLEKLNHSVYYQVNFPPTSYLQTPIIPLPTVWEQRKCPICSHALHYGNCPMTPCSCPIRNENVEGRITINGND